ncbi:hypothetical protein TNCV_984111 [Trichonephila clavipes]|nr:hypothetical protein TNCV_984111 [Trichonephila clavipes]
MVKRRGRHLSWHPPLLSITPYQQEDVSALDRFIVHRFPTRRVFGGTRLELVTRQATIRYPYHLATAATPADNAGIKGSEMKSKSTTKMVRRTLRLRKNMHQIVKKWFDAIHFVIHFTVGLGLVRGNKYVSSGYRRMWESRPLMSWLVQVVLSLTPVPLSSAILKIITSTESKLI